MTSFQSREQWRYVFILSAMIHYAGIIFYAVFASGELQDWADPRVEEEKQWNPMNEAVPVKAPVSRSRCRLASLTACSSRIRITVCCNANSAARSITDRWTNRRRRKNPSRLPVGRDRNRRKLRRPRCPTYRVAIRSARGIIRSGRNRYNQKLRILTCTVLFTIALIKG
jgi:hypothetical protein